MLGKMHRRRFLKTTAAVGATAVTCGVWSEIPAAESRSPNEKVNVACVGVGGMAGTGNLVEVSHQNIVALCDIDENILNEAAKSHPKAEKYFDFRLMLEVEGHRIDTVVVSTPDNAHATAAMMAMKMGKHCYCEKPLGQTVYEARMMAECAKQNKVATQMGTQTHAGENYRRVVEIIQSGTIGPIEEVHAWNAPVWRNDIMKCPEGIFPVPPNLHWDLWLGPAKNRPYAPEVYHPANWRRWWDFGSGTLGDIGCHLIDLPFWALGLRYPTTVEAEGPPVDPETCPLGLVVRYEFPARGDLPPVRLTWYDGNRVPKEIHGHGIPVRGVMFVGKKGQLFADYGGWKLYPEKQFEDYQPPAPTIPRSIGHHDELFKACKEGTPTTCNFDYSGALAEAVQLGNVAYRVGQKLEWDPVALKAINCPEADKYICRQFREGWTL